MHRRVVLAARDPAEAHRASTPLELLFDLVIVIAIAAVTAAFHHALAEGHGAEALPRFLLLFVTIWWAWMGVTWFASAFGQEDALYKLLVGTIMTGALIFAAGAGSFFTTMDLSWGLLGWSVMRLALAILWLRVAQQADYRTVALRFAGGTIAAQAAWFVLYFSTVPASGAAFAGTLLCLAIEFAVPAWAQGGRLLPWHRAHLAERYGLLMLIVLGEGLLAASFGFRALYGTAPDLAVAATGLAGVIIVFTLWWVYFDRLGPWRSAGHGLCADLGPSRPGVHHVPGTGPPVAHRGLGLRSCRGRFRRSPDLCRALCPASCGTHPSFSKQNRQPGGHP
jgi:low temperature requirement protein LtrA